MGRIPTFEKHLGTPQTFQEMFLDASRVSLAAPRLTRRANSRSALESQEREGRPPSIEERTKSLGLRVEKLGTRHTLEGTLR